MPASLLASVTPAAAGQPAPAARAEVPETAVTAPPAVAVPGPAVDHQDAQPDEPPPASVLPPPPLDAPPPLTPEQEVVRRVIEQKLAVARVGLAGAEQRHAEAVAAVPALERVLAAERGGLPEAAARLADARAALVSSQGRMRKWAVRLYAGQSLAPVRFLFETGDLRQLPRRVGLASGGAAAAQREVRARVQAVADVDTGLAAAVARVDELAVQVEQARVWVDARAAEVASWRADVAALAAGEDVAIDAVAFPVAGASTFADTFGAPRMSGTRFAHAHAGVDIFAAAGTPVVAFERGVLTRIGIDVLGGLKLWLVGQSGTRYYYAHLQAYAPGLADGQVVDVGQVLASVGNTGNAATTPHHLHFEIRPDGGAAVNPFPLLRQIVESIPQAP